MKKSILVVLSFVLIVLAITPVLAIGENTLPIRSKVKELLTAKNSISKVDLACVQKNVEKREDAIITANDQLSAAIKSALEQRKTALVAAWGITANKDRQVARLTAWNNFRTARQAARKTYNEAVKAAWRQANQDNKACKINTTGVEPQGADVSATDL